MVTREKKDIEAGPAQGQTDVMEPRRSEGAGDEGTQGRQTGLAPRRSRWSSPRSSLIYGRGGFPGTPWDLLRRIGEDMDQLLGGLGRGRGGLAPFSEFSSLMVPASFEQIGTGGSPVPWSPQIEVLQRPSEFIVRADLPGLSADDIQVAAEDGMLTLSGERRQESRDERDGFVRTERSYGSFFRSIPMPDGADEKNISARFRNGVLEVTVPTPARERGRTIKVQS